MLMNPFTVDPNILGKILPTRKNRWTVTKYTILMCTLAIGSILAWGNPENTLHKMGLEYAFILAGTISLAYSLSAVVDNAVVYTRSDTSSEPN